MPAYRFPKPYADFVARMRVPGGFLLILAFALLSRPSWTSILWGVVIALPGLLLRGWAAGHLRKNTQLTISGPYARVRNPLYAGSLVMAAGMVAAGRSWLMGAVFASVFVFIYLPVIELEEQHLRKLFPAYDAYAAKVPLLIPAFRRIESSGAFSIATFLKNEEYKAWLAFLAGVAVLAAKILWLSQIPNSMGT